MSDGPKLDPAQLGGARTAILHLLETRAPGATVCPSEAARALASAGNGDRGDGQWRSRMPVVHAAVDELLAEGIIRLSWKAKPLDIRDGPHRIGVKRDTPAA